MLSTNDRSSVVVGHGSKNEKRVEKSALLYFSREMMWENVRLKMR
jgi:hypothetical protein